MTAPTEFRESGEKMMNAEIQTLLETSRQALRIACAGSHAHTGRAGCLTGDPKDVAIVQLCETLLDERNVIQQLAQRIG